jgi:hypothetical protein
MVTRGNGTDWVALRSAFQTLETQHHLQKYSHRRWGRSDEFAGWIGEAALPKLTKEQALSLYAGSAGNRLQEFAANTIEDIRESLDFLMYDTIKLEGRFQECAAEGGAYKLAGAGKEFASYLLCLRDHSLFAVWNSNAERACQKLGVCMKPGRKGPLGIIYMDMLEASEVVRLRLSLADFRAVDDFAFSITRGSRWEGK